MLDLADPFWVKAKAGLFLLLGIMSAVLLVIEHPTLRVALLLAITIWSFCRLYYFAFYVVEKYLDPAYRFSGLISCVRYLTTAPRSPNPRPTSPGKTPPAGE
jgi:hypothetical protein